MAVRVRCLVGTLVLLLGIALVAAPAGAEPPLRLGPAVTDLADVLSPAAEAQVQASLDELRAQQGIQLFVVYVDTFDGSGAQEWAAETARLSQLGDDDALLAVAVQDRAYAYDVAGDFPLTDAQLARIASRDVEPRLAQDDWAGAAVAFADGMQSALGGGGFSWLPVLAALVVLAVAAGWLLLRRRRAGGRTATPGGPAGGPPPATLDDLTTEAAQALIETDDAIRTSTEELGFAQAQFGAQNTGRFATVIDEARADLSAAFAVQQKLDDEVPETDEQRRAMLTEILQRCRRANEALDAQAAEFDRLRDLQATAPQVLASLPGRLEQAGAEVAQARDLAATLARTYAAGELAAIADNPAQAEQRLTFAEQQVQAATDDMAADRAGEAIVAVVAAESAVGQASQLAAAVRRLQADLEAASAALPALQAEIGQELQAARAVPAQDVDTGPAVAAAEQALAAAAAQAGGLAAPVAALRRLQEADAALDAVLATAQQAGQQRVAAAAVLEQTITAARAEIAATGDFITTRRGAVGSEARTRLAEAERHLEQAVVLVGSDPRQALAHAQQADGLADQALALAQSDVSRARPDAVGGRGGFDIGSAVLGGILIDAMSGGFGGRGGFSPGRGGSRGGMFGGGGRATGSFGGSATRARRGGGGRF